MVYLTRDSKQSEIARSASSENAAADSTRHDSAYQYYYWATRSVVA